MHIYIGVMTGPLMEATRYITAQKIYVSEEGPECRRGELLGKLRCLRYRANNNTAIPMPSAIRIAAKSSRQFTWSGWLFYCSLTEF